MNPVFLHVAYTYMFVFSRGGRGQGVVSTRARGARSVMRPASGGRPGPRYQV